MKVPSIHITVGTLAKLLKETMTEEKAGNISFEALAQKIAIKAKGYALSHRSITVSNDKLKRDAKKVALLGRSDTAIFGQILTLVRKQHKHRGISLPKAGTPEFIQLKETAKLATDFMNEFGLEKRAAYKAYVTLGLKKMKNFSIHKFPAMHGSICKDYEAISIIESDINTEKTREAHDYYIGKISAKIGFATGYEENPEKYICFVEMVATCLKRKIRIKDYIDAQFHGFAWRDGVPDPYQLNGEKAMERVQKYLFENKGSKELVDTPKINFKKLGKK